MRRLLPFLAGLLLFSIAGCSSVVDAHTQKTALMTGFLADDQAQVQAVLDEKLKDPAWYNTSTVNTGDEIMWRLEAGSFHYLAGHYDRSLTHLERAEELIADFDQRAIINLRRAGAESTMLLTNLNALPYRGFCRDRVMLPVIKALAYLGKKDPAGFRTELFRLRETQDRIITEYESYFREEEKLRADAMKNNPDAARSVDADKVLNNASNRDAGAAVNAARAVAHRGYGRFLNPLAIFLSGYGYMRDGDFQNAIVDFERLYQAMPDHPDIQRYHITAQKLAGRDLPPELAAGKPFPFVPGRGTVLVIFANGRSAALRQETLYIPVILPDCVTLAMTAWPVCEYYPAPYTTLQVRTGDTLTETSVIADMDGILSQEYTDRLPGMIARIILSTAVKEIASYAAISAANQADEAVGLAVSLAATAYKAAFNTADTRTWELLPREFQIAEIPLPPDRTLTIAPNGTAPVTVPVPPQAGSAILYVCAPAAPPAPWKYRLFELP